MLRQYQRILFTCGHRSLTAEVKGSTDHLCSDLVRLGRTNFEYLGTRIHAKAQKRVDNYDRIQGENMERVQESAMHVFGNQLTILATDFLSPFSSLKNETNFVFGL